MADHVLETPPRHSQAAARRRTRQRLPHHCPCCKVAITDAIQQDALAQVPTILLGLIYTRSDSGASLKDMLSSQAPFFCSVRRA